MNLKKRNIFIFTVGAIFFTIAFMLSDIRFFVGNNTDQKNKPESYANSSYSSASLAWNVTLFFAGYYLSQSPVLELERANIILKQERTFAQRRDAIEAKRRDALESIFLRTSLKTNRKPFTHNILIYSAAAGVVISAGQREGYGNFVEIKHGNGLVSQYAYNLQIFVKGGDKVRKGQRIAKIGHKENTGKSHPHFQIIRDSHFSERNNNIIKK